MSPVRKKPSKDADLSPVRNKSQVLQYEKEDEDLSPVRNRSSAKNETVYRDKYTGKKLESKPAPVDEDEIKIKETITNISSG